jgi:hypothetical protein
MTSKQIADAVKNATPETRRLINAASNQAAHWWASYGSKPTEIQTAIRIAIELCLMAAQHPRKPLEPA